MSHSEQVKKLLLIDFDGTIVDCDLLDELIGFHVGELKANDRNSAKLADRINRLQGLRVSEALDKLDALKWLDSGAITLFRWCRENEVKTIVNSGNIVEVLKWFQAYLYFDHIVGTEPEMAGGHVVGITTDKTDMF